MCRRLSIVVLGLLLSSASCARHERPYAGPPDEIDSLVARLSPYSWDNGPWQPPLGLPRSASTKELLDACFPSTVWWDTAHVHRYELIRERAVHVEPRAHEYIAALVATDKGRKIVMLRYEPEGWWFRTFNARHIESSAVQDTAR